MKKFFLHTLFGILACVNASFGLDFPKTYTSSPCVNCTPPGYSVVSGGPVALSNMAGVGGSPLKNWANGFSNPPSSSKAIDANTGNVFLTLKYSSSQQDKVAVLNLNVEKGVKYTFRYYVMTSRAHLTAATVSDYASSAKLEITGTDPQSGLVPVVSKTTYFTPGVNVDSWVEQTVTFVAPTSYLHFELSSIGDAQGSSGVSYVNFDIYSKPFDCVVPGGQVTLFHGGTLTTPFSCATTNLYDLIQSSAPVGTTPVWGINPNSSYPQLTEEEAKAAGVKPSDQYYYAFYKTPGGCYNTDISTARASFNATPTQVALTSNQASINCINQTGVNLTAQIAPTNYKVLWFTNDKHQGFPVDKPLAAPVNTYYAFYFDTKNNCYSVDKADATAIFSVVGSTMCCNDPKDPSNQIPLLNTDVKIVAPAQTYDLTKLIPANISIPPNTVIEWYTNASHTGSPISDPKHVGAGQYYVFAHDLSNGCFNVPLSKSVVNVSKACNAGSTPVALVNISNQFFCQGGQVALNDIVASVPPAGTSVVWFDNSTHSGSPISTGAVDGAQYYAYYYDAANQCYSPPSSEVSFLSKQVYLNCGEDGCELSLGCPPAAINLNALHVGEVPSGWELRWFNNTTHSGQQLANPTNVTEAGEYYSFYYNVAKQCYNKTGLQNGGNDQANKKVTVTAPPCTSGPQLNVRVALQGAIQTSPSDDIMRADLQTYFGSSGLLPTTSPYGDLATCPEIGDPSKMNSVVDWVKVEVRDAVDPSILLESKSLILWASGFIGNTNGTSQPFFTSQPKPVRIVIKHRNHLAVMSNPIQDFSSGVVDYDFTTSISQASNEFGDPVQMIQVNGFWCMQLGDLTANPDLAIDGADGTDFKVQFKAGVFDAYNRADTNMDGVVDGLDGSLFKINFLLGLYSSIINY